MADEVIFGVRRRAALFGWMATISLGIAFVAVIAMVMVLPLKEVRPYLEATLETAINTDLPAPSAPFWRSTCSPTRGAMC